MNHLLSSSLAIIFPWCSVWLTEVPSWESPGRSFSDSPLPSPWSLSSSSDSILYFFPIKGRGCLALRYWRFAFPYFGRSSRFTKYTTRRIRSWSTRWCWPKSGSVSTFLTSIWFPTGKIFPVSTLFLSFSGTESMGWPRWLRLTRQLIRPPSQFHSYMETFQNFQSEIFKAIQASCRIQPINVVGFRLSQIFPRYFGEDPTWFHFIFYV